MAAEVVAGSKPDTVNATSSITVIQAGRLHAVLLQLGAVLLTLLGLACFSAQLRGLWLLWTTDALRSLGMFLPLVSAVLTLRAWRSQPLVLRGSWWGLLPILMSLCLAQLASRWQAKGLVVEADTGVATISLAPVGLLLWLYLGGAVLLFAGARAWRTVSFPLLLVLLVNPVPGGLDRLIDLPLQDIGAQTARWFAHVLSVPVQGEVRRLMFSPALGIFIAPGCDGLRGAVAMGYLALIGGYLYRMQKLRWALYVLAAVLLAYLFNLIRLCAVIGYYWFALRVDWLGRYGAEADYALGAVLFSAAVCFLLYIPRLGRDPCTSSSAS